MVEGLYRVYGLEEIGCEDLVWKVEGVSQNR